MMLRRPGIFSILQLSVLCLLLLGISNSVKAQEAETLPKPRVGFSPPRFELDWDGKGSTESLSVVNLSDSPLSVEVSVANWDLDENNQTRVLPPDEQSLDQWMIINPLKFTIDADSTQTVRFAVRPRVEPRPGEHRAMIFLKELVAPSADGDRNLRISFRFGLPVYLHVGNKQRSGTLHAVDLAREAGGNWLKVDFSATGSAYARLDASYAIWGQADFPGEQQAIAAIGELLRMTRDERSAQPVPFGRLPGTPVLPGYRRTLKLPLELPSEPGRFVLAVTGNIGEVEIRSVLEFSN